MGKKRSLGKSSNKSQAVFVDEEASISAIKNQEFVAMRAVANNWPAPSTKEEQLKELADEGLI